MRLNVLSPPSFHSPAGIVRRTDTDIKSLEVSFMIVCPKSNGL